MTIELLLEKAQKGYTQNDVVKWVTALPKIDPKKEFLLTKIKNKNYSKEELIEWISTPVEVVNQDIALEEVKNVLKPKKGVPTKYKKGDTLMHPIFRHPYVLLEQKDGFWICGLLTSEHTCSEILEKANSRFFSESYFTKVIFTQTSPIGTYMYPFDNPRQLTKILKQLKGLFV